MHRVETCSDVPSQNIRYRLVVLHFGTRYCEALRKRFQKLKLYDEVKYF